MMEREYIQYLYYKTFVSYFLIKEFKRIILNRFEYIKE